jgi:hypothetical protein
MKINKKKIFHLQPSERFYYIWEYIFLCLKHGLKNVLLSYTNYTVVTKNQVFIWKTKKKKKRNYVKSHIHQFVISSINCSTHSVGYESPG